MKSKTLITKVLLVTSFVLVQVSFAETNSLPTPKEGEKCTLSCVEAIFKAPTVGSLDSLDNFTAYQKAWMKQKFLGHFPNGINLDAARVLESSTSGSTTSENEEN